MGRKRDGLVPIGKVFSGLGGSVKEFREASPQDSATAVKTSDSNPHRAPIGPTWEPQRDDPCELGRAGRTRGPRIVWERSSTYSFSKP